MQMHQQTSVVEWKRSGLSKKQQMQLFQIEEKGWFNWKTIQEHSKKLII